MAYNGNLATPPKYELQPSRAKYFGVNIALRVLLFATSLVSVVVMVTSKQTKLIAIPGFPNFKLEIPAKFNYSPAFIYLVAALSVACLYSIITTLASLSVISKPARSKKFLLLSAFGDVLMLGVVASATGAAGAVAYIGLKGNKHSGWAKTSSVFDKYRAHVGSSVALSFLSAILLVSLAVLSTYSIYKRIRD